MYFVLYRRTRNTHPLGLWSKDRKYSSSKATEPSNKQTATVSLFRSISVATDLEFSSWLSLEYSNTQGFDGENPPALNLISSSNYLPAKSIKASPAPEKH